MRSLTDEERRLIEHRQISFEGFLAERMPVLSHFMKLLDLPNPNMVLVRASLYLPSLSDWLCKQEIEPDDLVWLTTRVGYFVGEYLVQEHGGCWFLNDIPDSRYFAEYVVGRFSRVQNQNTMVDPIAVAASCLSELPGRDLKRYLSEIDSTILQSVSSP